MSPTQRFIAGYVKAAAEFGVEYTPIVDGAPSLFPGGAAFPGNDWTVSTRGEEYCRAFPPQSHRALGRIRAFHLRVTRRCCASSSTTTSGPHDDVVSFDCR